MTASIARDLPERSTAMARGFGRVLDRASLVGGVAAVASAALFSMVARSSLPWELALLGGAVIGTLAGLAAARLLIPTRLLRAFEAFSWLGRSEMDRFVERTGSKVPVRRGDIERWLEQNPPNPAMRLSRVEVLAYIGRLDEARAELDAFVPTSPELAFERASLVQYIGWLTDGDPRIDQLETTIAELDLGADQRRAADVTIAIAHARQRFMRAEADWDLPLVEVRGSLGSAAGSVVLRDWWRPLATLCLFVALVGGALASLLPALP